MITEEALTAALRASGLPEWLHSWSVKVSARRRNSIGAEVTPDGCGVVFTTPAWVTADQFVSTVHKLLPAVQAKLATLIRPRQLVNGEGFALFGVSYRLKLMHDGPDVELRYCPLGQRRPGDDVTGSMGSARFLCLRRDTATAQTLIDWYAAQLATYAQERIAELSQRLGISPATLEIRQDRRRAAKWGTYLETAHLITLHWSIAQLPRRLADYVIMHEVAHSARPGDVHGPKWQRVMYRVMPDWEARRRELEREGVWFGALAPDAENVARDYRRAARFAGKFAADTLLLEGGTYVEPTDEAFTRVFAECVKPPTPELYPAIRAVFTHRHPQPAPTAAVPQVSAWSAFAATLPIPVEVTP